MKVKGTGFWGEEKAGSRGIGHFCGRGELAPYGLVVVSSM